MFILIHNSESNTLTKPFTTYEAAEKYALDEIKFYDNEKGVVNKSQFEECVATIHSDGCEDPYVIVEEELDQTFSKT